MTRWLSFPEATMRSGLEAHRLLRLLIDGRIVGRVEPVGETPDELADDFTDVEVSRGSLDRWIETQADVVSSWPKECVPMADLPPEAAPFLPVGTGLVKR